MHVREVEHRPHPVDRRGDLDDVVDRAELAHAAHHLDPERHSAVLRLEPLAQLAELLADRVDRLLALRPSRKPGWKTTSSRAARLRDPGRVVEHPDRHVQLLAALGVAHEPASGACTERAMSARGERAERGAKS